MDNTKDKNVGENVGQESTQSLSVPQKTSDPIAFFKDDNNFVFVYKKTEKLATAIYLVTNLLSDNEPIKWTLRKKAGEMVSFMLGLKDTFFSSKTDFIHTAKHTVLELTSLLQIASRGGLISEMNFTILKQEFSHVIDAIESFSVSGNDLSKDALTPDFFGAQENPPKNLTFIPKEYTKDAIKESGFSHRNTSEKPKPKPQDTHLVKRSNRQNTILGLLRKKSNLTIKDISEVIKDCSEKTIQRELISFMSNGLVTRTGERRWSRYSLAS